MSIFKCKMCGGELQINPGESVAVCEYCGTTQTLPKLDDDRRANLYDRANHFRRNNDFDKAAGIYEQILNEDKTDAEAYWSLVLCRYGIEYVEDPTTHKRVPTVNRAQYTSVFDDEDYKAAIQYADAAQRVVYEAEAKAINEIQKGILEISQKEEPFDVFICYKETDANGRRTPDSVLATDLYHQLTQEGFKVFFSRITLEDKLGTAYEPYIFSALNSAKVMVVLGTKLEYFNAVWVKNEWSRYLALIRSGAKKVLIPAYRDMDPYDLPEEFSHLQAQDMSKLGFMQDLIRGIKKLTEVDKPAARETVVVQETTANTAPLLKRAFIFLEDGDWSSADEYCEKVLDLDPECAQAYLGKLMAELHIRRQSDLQNCEVDLDANDNYRRVVRFGDKSLKTELLQYAEAVHARMEELRKSNAYADGRAKMENGTVSGCEEAISLFRSISGWKDADEQICVCEKRIEEIAAKEARAEEERKIAAEKAAKKRKRIILIAAPIICACAAFCILWFAVITPNRKYNDAISLMDAGEYEDAITALEALGGYKDSAALLEEIDAMRYIGDVSKGETVFWGEFEQDNNTDNGKEEIEWIVLDIEDGRALLLSKYILDYRIFNQQAMWGTSWQRCGICTWLNHQFLNGSFTSLQRSMIEEVTLLSNDEACYYFKQDDARRSEFTAFAAHRPGVATEKSGWWLRSITNDDRPTIVRSDGSINTQGVYSGNMCGVRPALWVSLAD